MLVTCTDLQYVDLNYLVVTSGLTGLASSSISLGSIGIILKNKAFQVPARLSFQVPRSQIKSNLFGQTQRHCWAPQTM